MNSVEGGRANAVPSLVVDGGGAGDAGVDIQDGGGAWFPEYNPRRPYHPVIPNSRSFEGDPRLIMGNNGTRLQFVGGQPLMDRGLENLVLISLFTNEGWCGNQLMGIAIGSGFVAACNQPITRQALNEIRAAAERALKSPVLGRVAVTVTNPIGEQLKVHIVIEPPAKNPQELVLMKHGENWMNQAHDPAYAQISDTRWRKKLVGEDDNLLSFEGGINMEF